MGLGPIPATKKALKRAGLTIDQIELVELNEAFAAQAIACVRELKLDPAKVNLYGGALALGRPPRPDRGRPFTAVVYRPRPPEGGSGCGTKVVGVGDGLAEVVEGGEGRGYH